MKRGIYFALVVACAGSAYGQSVATYEVTFISTWSASTHPTSFPSNPHFSGLVGGTHNSNVTFWETGSTASLGIKNMAEFGSKSALTSEVQTAISQGSAERVLSGGGIGSSPGRTSTLTFDISADFPLVTLTSMLAPSPDWFVGVNGLPLLSSTGWESDVTVELFVYDAGTDSGSSYNSPNQRTNPPENIARITTSPFLVDGSVKSVGTFVFDLQTVVNDKGLTVTPASLALAEGGVAKPISISLAAVPTGDVTVSVAASAGFANEVSIATPTLTFTTSNWNIVQTVDISAQEDPDAGDEAGHLSITADGGGYTGLSASVVVAVDDNDTVGLTLDSGNITLAEGESQMVSVRLDSQPSANVTVTRSLDTGLTGTVTIEPESISFSPANWNQAQAFTISALSDNDLEDESGTITFSANGGDYADVTISIAVSIEDQTQAGLAVSPSSLELAESGSSKSVSVNLMVEPSAAVSVKIAAPGAFSEKVSVSPPNLTFTTSNWSQPQSVEVNAESDSDGNDEAGTLSLTSSGGGYDGVSASVSIEVVDDDAPGILISPESLSLAEGESTTASIKLKTAPSATVALTLSLEGGVSDEVALSQTNLTFTVDNWDTDQEVMLSSQEDGDSVDESGTLSVVASGGDYDGVEASVSIEVVDDDQVGILIAPESLTVAEGESTTASIRLETIPSATVELALSLDGAASEEVALSPTSLTFDSGNWDTVQEVTLSSEKDGDSVDESGTLFVVASGGDYDGVEATAPVVVEDADAPELVIALDSLRLMEEGVGMMVGVTLGALPSGPVTVAVSAVGDFQGKVSLSPASLVFTIADWQTTQQVTVMAEADDDTEDESGILAFTATGGGYDGADAVISVIVQDDDMPDDMCYTTATERNAPPPNHPIPGSNEGYWTTMETEILDPERMAAQIKGVGLGGWLMPEGYMLHTPQASPREINAAVVDLIGEAGAEEFWQLYRQFYVREKDIAAIKAWGFDHIRLPFHYNLFYDDETDTIDEAGFELLDRFLEWCREHGLGVILDMHAAPGAQSEHNIADSDGEARLWTQPEIYWPIARQVWTEIAKRYAEEKLIIGYDLLNEPVTPDGVDTAILREFYECLVPAVRKVDPHHIVFIEGNFFATTFGDLETPLDPNMVYAFHKYWNATNQGTINYLLDLREQANRPLWLGETGENSNMWFAAVVRLMEEHNIGWNWWTHKKISTTTSPLSAPFAEGYEEVLKYWRNEGPKPTQEEAREGLLGMARGLDIDSTEVRHGVLASLFDPEFIRSRKPFKEGKLVMDHPIPGQVHAADYDLGGHGFTYSDTDYQAITGAPGGGNSGASYRNDGVDIQLSEDPMGYKYNVGWTIAGEWLTYTVNVAEAGEYDLEARVASAVGGAFRVILSGEKLGDIEVGSTGGWQSWESRHLRSVQLPAGQHELRLYILKSDVNINTLTFTEAISRTDAVAEEIPRVAQVTALYPNPFADETNVEISLPAQASVRAEMFDMLGRLVYTSGDMPHGAGQHVVALRPDLVPGVYMLRLDLQMDRESTAILRPVTIAGGLR